MMGETLLLTAAILGGREQGAGEQGEAIRVLMMFIDGLRNQIEHIPADQTHPADFGELKAIFPFDGQDHFHLAHIL
jgi:hypothetical protein